MNPFFIANVGLAVFSFIFGLFVFVKSRNRPLGLIWFLFTSATAAWGIGGALIAIEPSPTKSLELWRYSYFLGVNWISIFFYHFVCIFIQEKNRTLLFLNYLIAICFLLIIPTPIFFNGVRFTFNSIYWLTPGVGGFLFMIWWNGLVVWSHIKLVLSYKDSDQEKKNKIRYFFLATAIGFGGASTEFLPQFELDIYPWGAFLATLYPFIMGYAMLKYQLMDIRIFLQRTGIMIGIYIVLLLSLTPFILSLNKGIMTGQFHSYTGAWIQVFLISGVLSLGPFFYAYLVRSAYWLRGHLTTGLTHELKSPLSNIQSAIAIIEEELNKPGTDKAKQLDYVEMVQQNVARLETFVKDLLTTAKINEGEVTLEKTRFDFTALINEVLANHRFSADKKGIHLIWPVEESILIYADRDKTYQVVSNLISNAIKFSNYGKVTVDVKQSDKELFCSITDEGPGIPKNDLNKIYTKFFQAQPSTKGSGLGLTIAKAWVEAHGGNIWAESEGEGKGTRVSFTLPTNT